MLNATATSWLESRSLDVELAVRLGLESCRLPGGGKLEWALERSVVDKLTGCWVWQRCRSHDGYGKAKQAGKNVYAHRVTYEAVFGLVPAGMELDHLCRVRSCCNPFHLDLVTHRENGLRGQSPWAQNAAKLECIHGHPLYGANLAIRRNGARSCRQCARTATRSYQRRKATNA